MASADESGVPWWWILLFVVVALAVGAGAVWYLGGTLMGT